MIQSEAKQNSRSKYPIWNFTWFYEAFRTAICLHGGLHSLGLGISMLPVIKATKITELSHNLKDGFCVWLCTYILFSNKG